MLRFLILICYFIYVTQGYFIYKSYPEFEEVRLSQDIQIILFTIFIHILLKIVPFWTEVIGNNLGNKIIDKYKIGKKRNK